ncbi:MAG: hypothetical protein GKR94_24380 [Gammaproteobacteria bacterium]|nr:hypothetical protein [Gammaproteobacteria bacterium]
MNRKSTATKKPTRKSGVVIADATLVTPGDSDLSVRERGIRDAKRAFERVKEQIRQDIRAEN